MSINKYSITSGIHIDDVLDNAGFKQYDARLTGFRRQLVKAILEKNDPEYNEAIKMLTIGHALNISDKKEEPITDSQAKILVRRDEDNIRAALRAGGLIPETDPFKVR